MSARRRQFLSHTDGKVATDPSHRLQRYSRRGVFRIRARLYLGVRKKLPHCLDAQKQKQWPKLQPIEIEGQTLGIVGLGTVGNELARKAKALGMRVIATKRTVTEKPDYVDQLGAGDFLPELLAQSDYVVLLLASVPSTFNIIGENELRRMKTSAYLINLTGGRAIDEGVARARAERKTGSPALRWTPSRSIRCRKIPNYGTCRTSSSRRASPALPVKNGRRCCRSLRTI